MGSSCDKPFLRNKDVFDKFDTVKKFKTNRFFFFFFASLLKAVVFTGIIYLPRICHLKRERNIQMVFLDFQIPGGSPPGSLAYIQ